MGAHGRNHPRRPRRILTALARMSQCFLCGARLLPVRPTLCPPRPPSLHAAINAGRGLGYFRRNVPGLPLPGLRRGGPAVISFVCGGLSGSREVAADRACQLDLKPVRSLKSLCLYER